MIFYLIVIVVTIIAVSLLNIFFNPLYSRWWIYILVVLGFTLLALIVDALVALIIRRCIPEKVILKDKKIYHTSDKEMRFYRFLKVDKWKDHIPELGGFTNFHKDKLVNPFDNEYIKRYVIEARYGALIHIYSVPASFLILLADYNMYVGRPNLILTIALPIAIVNAILIVLPAFILKYNLPRLTRIYENNIKIQEMNKN